MDNDLAADDSFTFDLTAVTTSPNGISVWGQGINNSNGDGNNTSFSNADNITFLVSNVSGVTTTGRSIIFDGFTGVTVASGDGNVDTLAEQNRTIDVNGTTVAFDNQSTANGFLFLQQSLDFGPVATVLFDNQGIADTGRVADGTLVARGFDFQFSSVPEPTSLALLVIGSGNCCPPPSAPLTFFDH